MRMHAAAAAGSAFVAGLAATSWTALTLAEFGRFGPVLPLLVFPVTAIAVFRLLSRGDGPEPGRAVAPEEWAAVAIACSTLLLTLPADEILLGGQDPSVYVHTAAAVARQGSLLLDEPDIAALAKGERRLLLNTALGVPQPFTGMWLLRDGRISPQFFHLYPSLMAVAWSLGGVRGALLVNPLLNVAAVLALYALAALLLGRRWALAAALLHACWAAQVRQAKFPTAELLAQLFLLAGAALLLRRCARSGRLLCWRRWPVSRWGWRCWRGTTRSSFSSLRGAPRLGHGGRRQDADRPRRALDDGGLRGAGVAAPEAHHAGVPPRRPVARAGARRRRGGARGGIAPRRTAAWRRFAERAPWRGPLCGWLRRPGSAGGSSFRGSCVPVSRRAVSRGSSPCCSPGRRRCRDSRCC